MATICLLPPPYTPNSRQFPESPAFLYLEMNGEQLKGSLGIAVIKPHIVVGCQTSDSHSSRDRGAERSV